VIGREFSPAAILELALADAEFAGTQLQSLISKGFIRSGGDDSLSFHHVLVRSVVYAGIPKALRADLHERAATWLEREAAAPDELLGYHLEQAARYKLELGQPDPALAERAGELLAAAGRSALWRGDSRAAASLLERALELTRPTRFDVHLELDLAWAYRFVGAGRQLVTLAEAAAEQAREAGDEAGEALARVVVARHLEASEDPNVDALERLARSALPLLEQAEDYAGLVYVWHALGWVASFRCRYEERAHAAEQALRNARLAGQEVRHLFSLERALVDGPRPADEALRVLDAALPEDADPDSLLRRAWLLAMLGRFDEAWQRAHEASARFREVTGMDGSDTLGEIARLAGDHEAAAQYFQSMCDWCEEHGLTGFLSSYAPTLGRSLCALGRYDEAEQLAERGRELGGEQDLVTQIVWRQTSALVDSSRGEHARAMRLAREAVAISDKTDGLNLQGDALCDLAEVLHASGRTEQAVATLEQALERYERKRNLAMTQRVRARVAELRPPFTQVGGPA
jgi:tetratricopeptide (TPR) repeat protein